MEHRCRWVNEENPKYIRYHDEEWGVPVHDDRTLFAYLILEGFQAGLSWECVLNKRDAFYEAFDGFDMERICAYDEAKCSALMADPRIIRNRRKIAASVENARVFRRIQEEFSSFDAYLKQFTNDSVICEPYTQRTSSPLSDRISADLKKRGMRFVGTTIIYSYLQAIGVICGHGEECDLFGVIPE